MKRSCVLLVFFGVLVGFSAIAVAKTYTINFDPLQAVPRAFIAEETGDISLKWAGMNAPQMDAIEALAGSGGELPVSGVFDDAITDVAVINASPAVGVETLGLGADIDTYLSADTKQAIVDGLQLPSDVTERANLGATTIQFRRDTQIENIQNIGSAALAQGWVARQAASNAIVSGEALLTAVEESTDLLQGLKILALMVLEQANRANLLASVAAAGVSLDASVAMEIAGLE